MRGRRPHYKKITASQLMKQIRKNSLICSDTYEIYSTFRQLLTMKSECPVTYVFTYSIPIAVIYVRRQHTHVNTEKYAYITYHMTMAYSAHNRCPHTNKERIV